MAIALKQGVNGDLARFTTGDALDINVISARNEAANITVGANLNSGLQVVLGNVDADVSVLRDLLLTRDVLPGAGAGSLGTGTTQYFDQVWVQAVNDNGPDAAAYNLSASGTSAGAYAIGVDPSLVGQSSATDLMTMLANMSTAISSGAVAQDTLPIENGVTIAAGDVVAVSITTSGRVNLAIAASGATQNGGLTGIASTGGTGDSGGTVNCTFTLAGSAEDVPGASFTPGSAVYISVAGGTPVGTAPSTVGQLVKRVGYATTATRVFIEPGPGIVL